MKQVHLNGTARHHLETAAIIGAVVLVAALLGVLLQSGTLFFAASPAGPILLGLMVRFPRLDAPAGWAAAALAFVLAGVLTGTSLVNILLITAISFAGVLTGYFLLIWSSEDDRRLIGPMTVLRLAVVLLAAAAVTALVGVLVAVTVTPDAAPAREPLTGFAYWLIAEFVNYLALVPVLLAIPGDLIRPYDFKSRPDFRQIDYRALAPVLPPALAVVAACIVAPYGAGFALTLVALVWCGLRYSVFATAALTLLATIWTLGGIPLGLVSGWPESDMSAVGAQVAVVLVGLAPLTVASVMAAHNQLRNRFEQIASRDLLSGLLSRHAFVERSEQLLALAARAQAPVAVLMLDIDHFKKINHTHGLGAGDRMIMTLAGVATTTLSDADVVGRLGGEEFAALLAGATPAEATAAAERIRHVFAATPTDLGNGRRVESTLSIGIGCAATAPSSIEPLLQVADEALSLAKGGGRNRIVRRDVVMQR